MKKITHPLFAPVLTVVFLLICLGLSYLVNPGNIALFYEKDGGLEVVTYTMYAVALITAWTYRRDYIGTKQQTPYLMFLFLWLIALLREMGAQHWLTSTDSTAIKLRFFTNPNNPLSEKIITAVIVLTVVAVIIKLLIQYVPKIIRGFFKLDPLYWTVCTFGAIGVVGKFADRFPGNYYKSTGVRLDPAIDVWFKLFEEGGEAALPLLFAVGIIQYHLMKKRKLFR